MATSGREWMDWQDRMQPRERSLHRRKLSPQQIDDIRRRRGEGESARTLALEYGVTTSLIRRYAPEIGGAGDGR
jgi:DNA invertase Pin-like site-specific DNA recombinase